MKNRQRGSLYITIGSLAAISLLYVPVQKGLGRDRMSITSLQEELGKIGSVKWTLSSANLFLVLKDIRRFRKDGLTDTRIWARFKSDHPSYARVRAKGVTDRSLIELLDLAVMEGWTLEKAFAEIRREKEIPAEIVALGDSVQRRLRLRFSIGLMLMATLIIGSGITLVLGLPRRVWFESSGEKKLFRAVAVVSGVVFLFFLFVSGCAGSWLEGAWSGILLAGGIWAIYSGARYAVINLRSRKPEKPKTGRQRMKK